MEFDRFIISVGNLTVGGTGKTPFVELLIRKMKARHHLAVLSRGYKRKTRGFMLANENDSSETLGDEPFQYFTKYGKEVLVAVGEKRALAIPQIIGNDEKTEVIILDDAYQHRQVKPDLNILLNDYSRPFYKDHVLPVGLLREPRSQAKRADIVVVTKCPEDMSTVEMENIKKQIDKHSSKSTPVYFSGIKYLKPQKLFGYQNFSENVILFTGIANSAPLEDFIEKHYNLLHHKKFPDHYSFTNKDLLGLIELFEEINLEHKCLLTTEKDMVRLISIKEEARSLMDLPVFYLPIELYFLENGDCFVDKLENKIKLDLRGLVTD